MSFPSRNCSKCKLPKDLRYFSPDKRASGGRRTVCKSCTASAAKASRQRKAAETFDIPAGHRRCAGCSEDKPAGKFNRSKGSKDGLTTYCRDCLRCRYPWSLYKGRY